MNPSRFLCERLLPSLVARTCEMPIPRSGEQGEKVNCFVVYIERNGRPYLFVSSIQGENLLCLEWVGDRFSQNKTISFKEIDHKDLFIVHYYGLAVVKYAGIYDLAINRFTRWPYIKIFFSRVADRFGQYRFNKKKLVTKQKADLLRFLLSRHLGGETSFDPFHLMSELYTVRWILHPDGERERRKLALHLEALVQAGDLRAQQGGGFALTGQAVMSIEEYEEQERKHTENVRLQLGMLFLTLTIVLLTLVQADIIKLPPLIDLSRPTPPVGPSPPGNRQ